MRTRIALGAGLVILLVASYPVLRPVGEILARGKPGVWGMPSWYVLLIAGYGIFTLAILSQAILFTLRKAHAWGRWSALLIGLTLVRGALYCSLAPPWQAPDEHAHFEYAALMGKLRRVPAVEDISPQLQQEIVSSMFDYDLWRLIKREPVTSPPEGFLSAGGISRFPATHVIDNRYLYYRQVGKDPPLSYLAPALVYAVFPKAHIALQLYMMRLTTVVLFVALMGAVIGAARRLLPDDTALAMSIPALLAFHPMLAHMGSVVNNDTLAAIFVTLLLSVLVAVFHREFTFGRGLAIVGLAFLGVLTKRTTVWTIPLIGCLVLIRVIRPMSTWARYVLLIVGVVAVAAALVSLRIPSGQARYWTPLSTRWGATVSHRPSADGALSLRVVGGSSEEGRLGQPVLTQTVLDLRGQVVDLTVQVRANDGEQQGALAVVDLDHPRAFRSNFGAGSDWHNVSLRFKVPDDALHLRVELRSSPQTTLYFDQVVLRPAGLSDVEVPPLRNASGEQVCSLGEQIVSDSGGRLGLGRSVQQALGPWQNNLKRLLADPRPLEQTFETFWGNFGAASVVPLPSAVYRILKYACILSLVGIGLGIGKSAVSRKQASLDWQRRALWLLGAGLLLALALVWFPLLANYGQWIPQGRYLFPAIVPIGVFLTLGWAQWMPKGLRPWMLAGLTIGGIALDCAAMIRLASYFYNLL